MVEIFGYIYDFNGAGLKIIRLENRAALEEYNYNAHKLNTTTVIIWDIDKEFLWLRMPEAATILIKKWAIDRDHRFNNVP